MATQERTGAGTAGSNLPEMRGAEACQAGVAGQLRGLSTVATPSEPPSLRSGLAIKCRSGSPDGGATWAERFNNP